MTPQKAKVDKFLSNLKLPRTAKQVKRLAGFLQFFRMFIPNLGKKLLGFYKMLKKDADFNYDEQTLKDFETLKEDLKRACEMNLKLPKPDEQYVILSDAAFYGAGYVLMIENKSKETGTKIMAPVGFGSKVFNEAQMKNVNIL